jgi:hypothetical protein
MSKQLDNPAAIIRDPCVQFISQTSHQQTDVRVGLTVVETFKPSLWQLDISGPNARSRRRQSRLKQSFVSSEIHIWEAGKLMLLKGSGLYIWLMFFYSNCDDGNEQSCSPDEKAENLEQDRSDQGADIILWSGDRLQRSRLTTVACS